MEPMKENKQVKQHHVDTSRPFTSVKEAVATFGQRILLPGKIHALNSKPVSPITIYSSHPFGLQPNYNQHFPRNQRPSLPYSLQDSKEEFMDVLKKLEAEIMGTKTEVRMLKERESDTEAVLASLNAELYKNMVKMTKIDADAEGKSAADMNKYVNFKENGEEGRRKELMSKMAKEYLTLAQILDGNKVDKNGYFAKTTKKKKKPIIPLL
ncbi:hypothetical protein Bca52824_048174 [Brassica carinata]|uniref:Uncharacterized protein n=3 Tax=Brassica TaxID=3705 RepID=A0A8X7UQN0_BRACI|nr:hypothetical protein Bca52824_048174 [Brassica carinata]